MQYGITNINCIYLLSFGLHGSLAVTESLCSNFMMRGSVEGLGCRHCFLNNIDMITLTLIHL